MNTTRRTFLQGTVGGGLAAGASLRLGPALTGSPRLGLGNDDVLIVIQAAGGYDLFQQLVPDHPVYRTARPTIGLTPAQCAGEVVAGSGLHWHPALTPFKTLFDRGELAVVQNVGYPRPNLSHFESEKKWYAVDPDANQANFRDGWLGRFLRDAYTGAARIPAIDVETRLNPAFSPVRVPVLTDIDAFAFAFDPNTPTDNVIGELALGANADWFRPARPALPVQLADALRSSIDASGILRAVNPGYQPAVTYPQTSFAQNLQLIARLVLGGHDSSVYYARRGGFDTHANLADAADPTQGDLADLLADVSGSILALLDDLRAQGSTRRVLVLVWSEFGRRLGQNGALGTDHGHGGLAWLCGPHVQAGLYGQYPDLSRAIPPYTEWFAPFDARSTDFRSLFATIYERWLGVPSAPLLGGSFPLLGAL